MKRTKNLIDLLVVAILISVPYLVNSQNFVPYSTTLPNVAQGSCDWADIDNDGYLDLAMMGANSIGQPLTKIFRNNAGVFIDIDANLIGLKNGSLRFGDYDRDGDYDLLVCGSDFSSKPHSLLYKNDNGSFSQSSNTFQGIYNGMAIFVDYDNDGLLDIFLSGDTLSYKGFTRIYHNLGNDNFEEVDFGFPGVISSSLSYGDYDNDGDFDLLLSGDIGGAYYTKLFRNDMGLFTEIPTNIEGVGAGFSLFMDFDKDGDHEILLMGNDLTLTPIFKIYRNDGNGSLQEVFVGITGLALGNISIADYNSDGYPDFATTGKAPGCGAMMSVLFYNNQIGSFWPSSQNLVDLSYSYSSWADFDNDGDSDLLLMGISTSGNPETVLYSNTLNSNGFVPNLPPFAPIDFSSEMNGNELILKWKPSPYNTNGKNIFYNVRVGLNPGSSEIMSTASNVLSGQMLLPSFSNVTQDTFWILQGLREADYFWSVQTIDPSYSASEFAPEETFSIAYTGIAPIQEKKQFFDYRVYADRIELISQNQGKWSLFSVDGIEIKNGNLGFGKSNVSLLGIARGIYILRIETEDNHAALKFLKR